MSVSQLKKASKHEFHSSGVKTIYHKTPTVNDWISTEVKSMFILKIVRRL